MMASFCCDEVAYFHCSSQSVTNLTTSSMSQLQLLVLLLTISQVLQVDAFQLHRDSEVSKSVRRVPRSPNKFESLKRREREQRLIELGAITPDIASDTPREIRAHEGDTVYLPCRVPHLGTHSVTWENKGAILSVDTMLVDPNPRLLVSNDDDMWRLVIKAAQDSDAGVYTCTVTTEPRQQRDVTLFVLPRSASLMHDSYGILLDDIRANLSAVWSELRSMRDEIRELRGATQQAEQDQEVWSTVEQSDLHHHHRTLQHHPYQQSSLAHSQREEAVVYEPDQNLVNTDEEDVDTSEEILPSVFGGRHNPNSDDTLDRPNLPHTPGSSRVRRPYRSSRRGSRRRQHRSRRVEVKAECVMHPAASRVPESYVSGTIYLSQAGDLRDPVSLDIQMTGFQESKLEGAVVSLSLRRYAAEEGRCYAAGDVFTGANTGQQLPEDLKSLVVGADGSLRRRVQLPDHFTLFGLGGVVGRSVVIYSEEEEDGLSSSTTGPPVACCTIRPSESRVPAF